MCCSVERKPLSGKGLQPYPVDYHIEQFVDENDVIIS
jgi:hypothetical protein